MEIFEVNLDFFELIQFYQNKNSNNIVVQISVTDIYNLCQFNFHLKPEIWQ